MSTPVAERRPVQARILDAAVALFAERGFDGTSVQEIVERAAVTKGALYHYFASKDDLLYEIYHALLGIQLADRDRILALQLAPGETLRAIILSLVTTTAAHIEEAAVFSHEMYRLDRKRMLAVRADRRGYHESFRTLVAAGQSSGEFSRQVSAETVTLAAFGVVNQMPLWYRRDGRRTAEEIGNDLADFVLAALKPAG